jgi:hypothetical protein
MRRRLAKAGEEAGKSSRPTAFFAGVIVLRVSGTVVSFDVADNQSSSSKVETNEGWDRRRINFIRAFHCTSAEAWSNEHTKATSVRLLRLAHVAMAQQQQPPAIVRRRWRRCHR